VPVFGLAVGLGMLLVVPARGATSAAQVEGLRLYEAGRFAEAIPFFDQVLERHPRDLDILNKRGICYLRTDQPGKALADFDRVNGQSVHFARIFAPGFFSPQSGIPQILARKDFAETWGNRGVALLMLGRDPEALESFQRAVSLWSLPENRPSAVLPQYRAQMIRSHAAAYQGLGQSYHRLGQDAPAAEAYNQAIAIDPTDPNGFAGRADVLAAERLYDQAIADCGEAIRLDPTHSRAFASRGIVLYTLGRDESALADLDRAIALDPKFARAYSFRGAAHARRGQNALALADYDALITLMPENAGAYKDRGGVLVRLGRFDQAIKDLDEAIRLDPKRASAYQNRGAAYNSMGQYERAVKDLTEAIRLDPDMAGAYSNRGLARFAIGEYDQAVVDLSQAIQLEPHTAITHFNRAVVFDRLGIRDRALLDYQEAVRLEPRLAAAYAAIGRIESQLGRRDAAIHDFDMAVRLDPKEAGVYHERANARRESGDWLGALADYDRAVAIDPKRAETYAARGWARLAAGFEWADNDARAYLALRGWNDGLSPYMALLAVLGARGTAREPAARRLLDEAVANLPRQAWPLPILRYFQGELTEAALLQAAAGIRQQTEAHAFLGLHRLQAGSRPASLTHLQWVCDHGSPGSIATDVARATLNRVASIP
jgi:tetratricopeptide (TPR) repeat protein